MREIKITYNHIKNIRTRADTICKDLEKRDLLDTRIQEEILWAKSLDALDHLVNSFSILLLLSFYKNIFGSLLLPLQCVNMCHF